MGYPKPGSCIILVVARRNCFKVGNLTRALLHFIFAPFLAYLMIYYSMEHSEGTATYLKNKFFD